MKRWKCLGLLGLCLGLFCLACSGSSDGSDGGEPDGFDGGDPGGDRWIPPDTDLGEDFGLAIPPGTSACAVVVIGNPPPATVRQQMSRVTFRPGVFRLSRTEDSFEADLVETIEWGEGPEEVSPSSPGQFSRTLSGTEQDGAHVYQYTQGVTHGGSSFTFSLKVSFEVANGQPVQQTLVLDEHSLANRGVELMGTGEGGILYLASCRYDLYTCSVNEYEAEGGDFLKVEICGYCPKDWICKSSMGGVKKAVFQSGQDQRVMDDYFQSGFTWRHHNWGGDLLVWFGDPVGTTHGLYLGSGAQFDLAFEEMNYLGEDMNILDTREVVRADLGVGW